MKIHSEIIVGTVLLIFTVGYPVRTKGICRTKRHVLTRPVEELLYHILDITNTMIQICAVLCHTTTEVIQHVIGQDLTVQKCSYLISDIVQEVV